MGTSTLFWLEEHHEEHLRTFSLLSFLFFWRGGALLGIELEALHLPSKYITNKALLSAHVLFFNIF